ncbi:glycosyltransferase family 2 protein [Paraburkholderia sp. IW21]|uniref:glycosyltransferase family 2 protein n=1 Tax=Paraburkholderia sp. IW21 TaxID=3242488 RepID=UPI0035229184
MRKLLTIITPTFNRAEYLPRLHESLKAQSHGDFEWLIVDDGSTDGTPAICARFIAESAISIRYIRKENGGKHTAVNVGVEAADSTLIFIVDSDDYVTDVAVSRIASVWREFAAPDRSGISFLRGTSVNVPLGKTFPKDFEISSYLEMRFNRAVSGDKAEVYRTDILKQFRFPEFEGERFLAEDAVWARIGLRYTMVHVNEIIYVSNYLEAGLTRSGKSLMVRCPNGAIESVKWFLSDQVRLKVRSPMAWRYVAYGFFAGKSLPDLIASSKAPFFVAIQTPLGIALYAYWKHKFRKELARTKI